MKQKLSFVSVLLVSFIVFAKANAAEEPSRFFSGKVGRLILKAMKSSGIKSVCKEDTCTYSIKDFYTAQEGDGCGGGTTSYEASYTNADKSKFSYSACDGDGWLYRKTLAFERNGRKVKPEVVKRQFEYIAKIVETAANARGWR